MLRHFKNCDMRRVRESFEAGERFDESFISAYMDIFFNPVITCKILSMVMFITDKTYHSDLMFYSGCVISKTELPHSIEYNGYYIYSIHLNRAKLVYSVIDAKNLNAI